VTPERARAVALQIQRVLNPLEVEWNGKTYAIGASLGVATITNGYESTAAWMAAADAACYDAKRNERGQVRFAPATDLVARFLTQFAEGAGLTLHVRLIEGRDTQHVLEAIFKGLGVALAQSCRPRREESNG